MPSWLTGKTHWIVGGALVLSLIVGVVWMTQRDTDSGPAVERESAEEPQRSVDETTPPPASVATPTAGTPNGPGDDSVPLAPAGEKLERIESPPERAIWALSADSYDAGVSVQVEFEPYGIGPESFGPSVVALVSSAKATPSEARVPDLAGRNVVFIVGATVVETGGRYRATMQTQQQEDRVIMVLTEVERITGE